MFFINCKLFKSLRVCWLLGSTILEITAIYSWRFILGHFYTTKKQIIWSKCPTFFKSHSYSPEPTGVPSTLAAICKKEGMVCSLHIGSYIFTIWLTDLGSLDKKWSMRPSASAFLKNPHNLKNILSEMIDNVNRVHNVCNASFVEYVPFSVPVMHLLVVLVHTCLKFLYLTLKKKNKKRVSLLGLSCCSQK